MQFGQDFYGDASKHAGCCFDSPLFIGCLDTDSVLLLVCLNESGNVVSIVFMMYPSSIAYWRGHWAMAPLGFIFPPHFSIVPLHGNLTGD